MKALVCVKRVIDFKVKLRIKSHGTGVGDDLDRAAMAFQCFPKEAERSPFITFFVT